MKYSTIYLGILLSGFIAGSIVFSGPVGKLAGAASITSPSPIKVYSAEKGDYIMSEAVVKTKEEWKKLLTPEQFHILREKGTERAFSGKYDKDSGHGIYRCAVCGLDLFRSEDKYDSGTGWPSFIAPISAENI